MKKNVAVIRSLLVKYIKPVYKLWEKMRLYLRRRRGKFINKILNRKFDNSYTFCILCIKKTEYADMAIDNINSLLSLNPTHNFILYCDSICAQYLKQNKNRLDYLDKVVILDRYGLTVKAWQYYKIEVHIEAAQNNHIDTDADGIWHHDPILDRSKITMLAKAHDFRDIPNEITILGNLFPNNSDWLTFRHCVAAFVSMPSKFMNQKVANDMRRINDMIFTNPLRFLKNDKERGDARRLSEEFAVNLAIQSNYPPEKLVVLKSKDGWGNKKLLQSLYYGCGNQINE